MVLTYVQIRTLTRWSHPRNLIATLLTLLLCFCFVSQAHATRVKWETEFTSFSPETVVPTCGNCHDHAAAGPGELTLNDRGNISRSQTSVTVDSPTANSAGASWRYRDVTNGTEEYLPRLGILPAERTPQSASIDFPIGTESKTIQYCAGQREPLGAAAAIFHCGSFEITREPLPNQTPVFTLPTSSISLELEETKTSNINVVVDDDNDNELDYRWTWDNTNASVSPATLDNRGINQTFQFTGVSAGSTNFTLTVTDPSGASDSISVAVTVIEQAPNNGPTIVSPQDGVAIALTNRVGQNLFVTLSSDSREIDNFSFSNFDSDVVNILEVDPGFYIVSALANGSSTISFTVVDVDGLSSTSTVCVSVRNFLETAPSVTSRPSTACNDFPEFISANPSDSFQLEPGDVVSATLAILDDDPDSHIRRMSVEDPSIVQVDDGAGDAISIQAVAVGTSFINVTVEDAAGQVLEVPLTVVVQDEVIPNTPPMITAHAPIGNITMIEGNNQVITLTVVDLENDTVSLSANSDNSSVVDISLSSTNSVSLRANAIGTATISVTPSDLFSGSGPDYTFNVQVIADNAAPIAIDDYYLFTFKNPTQSLSILDNDIDTDGDELSIELLSNLTSLGGSVIEDGGAIIYTPPGVFNTTDRFEYQVRDARGATSSMGFVEIEPSDVDGDGIFDGTDNCVLFQNVSQIDSDNDGIGDVCDPTPQPDEQLLVLGSGKALVETECLTCHETGLSGAPLFGDDLAWQNRINAAGGDISLLVNSVITGLGAMQSFGQRFTAAELNAAVLYLIGRETPPIIEIIDDDSDGIANENDNCVAHSNPDQTDIDNNGIGDECETDKNNDGVLDYSISFQLSQGDGVNARLGGITARSGSSTYVTAKTRSNLTGLTYDWSNSHPKLLDVASIVDGGSTLQILPGTLDPSQHDAVVVVSGNGITARGRARLMILNGGVGEQFTDVDQDGYPVSTDSDDSNPRRLLANPALPTNTITAQSMQALAIGDVAAVSAALNGYTSASFQLDDEAFLQAANVRYNNVVSMAVPNLHSTTQNINLEIRELDNDLGSVVIQLPGNLPLNPQLQIYRPNLAQWNNLSTTNGDSQTSAPLIAGACPSANSPNYQNALTTGFGCVRLTVKDGGANDLDELRDGVVTLLFNIGSPKDPISPTDAGGGGGGSAMALLVYLAVLGWRRRLYTSLVTFNHMLKITRSG